MKIISKQKGFTLVELMIVVLIVGILSAIAYPSYTDYVRNSKLPEATAQLSQAKNQMEHYFQDERTYIGGCTSSLLTSYLKDTPNFRYSCQSDDESFLLSAFGTTPQVIGFHYTINQIGEKQTLDAPEGYMTGGCWIVNKNGCI